MRDFSSELGYSAAEKSELLELALSYYRAFERSVSQYQDNVTEMLNNYRCRNFEGNMNCGDFSFDVELDDSIHMDYGGIGLTCRVEGWREGEEHGLYLSEFVDIYDKYGNCVFVEYQIIH